MGLLFNKVLKEQLKLGDHIYTWRNGYSYSHHHDRVGDGKMIHLTRAPGLIIFSSSNESSPSHPPADRVVCCSIEEISFGWLSQISITMVLSQLSSLSNEGYLNLCLWRSTKRCSAPCIYPPGKGFW